jgi:hypothetical protein
MTATTNSGNPDSATCAGYGIKSSTLHDREICRGVDQGEKCFYQGFDPGLLQKHDHQIELKEAGLSNQNLRGILIESVI